MQSSNLTSPEFGADEARPLTRAGAGRGPVVIEAHGLYKTFRIPEQRIDTLKERALHAFSPPRYRELRVFENVSLDVHKGEFFGIVGRNGSGKSTLLKVLSGIYAPDRGTVRMAGRVAPFVELGVGVNPELTARENILLNGVLMGLSPRESRRRQDAVLDFAELQEFIDLKLKNYSSGMLVRLAFAIMIQADADIMLIDEVLAVGDIAFGQKCMDTFYERKAMGKTIVLVTHDMATVQSMCHRAMLIHDGEVLHIGDPEDVALQYYRLNYASQLEAYRQQEAEREPDADPVGVEINGRAVRAQLLDPSGGSVVNVEMGVPLTLEVLVEAAQQLDTPRLVVHVVNAEHVVVFEFSELVGRQLAAGERVALRGEIENRLTPGRYFIDLWIARGELGAGNAVMQGIRLLQFVVYGAGAHVGVVAPESTIDVVAL